jgi:protein SCO1/2
LGAAGAEDGQGEIAPPKEKLRIGDAVADFELRDQNGRAVRMSDFLGKVVAVNFIYTRCPLPDVCPRLSASFATWQKRFAGQARAGLGAAVGDGGPGVRHAGGALEYAKQWSADEQRMAR